jgi:thiol-disulfide isomerase/thioredoxin
VPDDVLAQEDRDKKAYLVARDKLIVITPDEIAAESSTGVPLLVDFWAEWCGPCRMVTPVLAELADKSAGRIVVRKIDVDQFDGIWERFDFGGKKQLMAELEPHLGAH